MKASFYILKFHFLKEVSHEMHFSYCVVQVLEWLRIGMAVSRLR